MTHPIEPPLPGLSPGPWSVVPGQNAGAHKLLDGTGRCLAVLSPVGASEADLNLLVASRGLVDHDCDVMAGMADLLALVPQAPPGVSRAGVEAALATVVGPARPFLRECVRMAVGAGRVSDRLLARLAASAQVFDRLGGR